jgi:hypothetical protein
VILFLLDRWFYFCLTGDFIFAWQVILFLLDRWFYFCFTGGFICLIDDLKLGPDQDCQMVCF